jgi:hypothetical protein
MEWIGAPFVGMFERKGQTVVDGCDVNVDFRLSGSSFVRGRCCRGTKDMIALTVATLSLDDSEKHRYQSLLSFGAGNELMNGDMHSCRTPIDSITCCSGCSCGLASEWRS